ncbi:PilZ domain-containing protein [Alteromonadaceae bacterium Bs31]|nr:PilZ domain-containing protein [Alteromonadaceae bacterium Bs31]
MWRDELSLLLGQQPVSEETHYVDDRRRFERKATSIRAEITHPAFGTIIGFTRDISDGGAQVSIERHPAPPVGTVVSVKFRKVVGPINEEPVSMRVMHSNRSTIGLMFVPS